MRMGTALRSATTPTIPHIQDAPPWQCPRGRLVCHGRDGTAQRLEQRGRIGVAARARLGLGDEAC